MRCVSFQGSTFLGPADVLYFTWKKIEILVVCVSLCLCLCFFLLFSLDAASTASSAAKVHARKMVRTDNREQTLDAFLKPSSQTTVPSVSHSVANSRLKPTIAGADSSSGRSSPSLHTPMDCDEANSPGSDDVPLSTAAAASSDSGTRYVLHSSCCNAGHPIGIICSLVVP